LNQRAEITIFTSDVVLGRPIGRLRTWQAPKPKLGAQKPASQLFDAFHSTPAFSKQIKTPTSLDALLLKVLCATQRTYSTQAPDICSN